MASILGGTPLSDEIASIADVLRGLQAEEEAAIAPAASPSGGSPGGSIGSAVLGAVENVFGFGLNPLVSGLEDLFGGGGGTRELAPLVPYVAPPPISVNAGINSSSPGVFAVDTAAGGTARPAPAANITVQVQALDSQSILDRSQDIARAVRQAMLESTTLNDVIRAV
jgi:hypothetical protein